MKTIDFEIRTSEAPATKSWWAGRALEQSL